MSEAYDEIIKILSELETEENIPSGTLKRIYDIEKSVVHLRSREQKSSDLINIIVSSAEKVDDPS